MSSQQPPYSLRLRTLAASCELLLWRPLWLWRRQALRAWANALGRAPDLQQLLSGRIFSVERQPSHQLLPHPPCARASSAPTCCSPSSATSHGVASSPYLSLRVNFQRTLRHPDTMPATTTLLSRAGSQLSSRGSIALRASLAAPRCSQYAA